MKPGNIISGLLLGAVVGVVAGILLSPEKGSVTRNRLLRKKEEYTDTISEYLSEIFDSNYRKTKRAEIAKWTRQLKARTEEEAIKYAITAT
ncbi:MAG: YtxH domain-containing protein [Bacteroidales bacterium]|jgi:gas vesicle protein